MEACSNSVEWAKALLTEMGYPTSTANQRAIVAWSLQEGGGFETGAVFNPLNTTRVDPGDGSTDYNWAHVKNYLSCEQGLDKTVETLRLSPYGDIRAALASGGGNIANAHGLEVWVLDGSLPASCPEPLRWSAEEPVSDSDLGVWRSLLRVLTARDTPRGVAETIR